MSLSRVWHMPHGIFLLDTPKSTNIYHLLSEQPSKHDSHATYCILSPSQTSAPLPSPLARNNINTSRASHQDQKGLMLLLALLLVSIPDALLKTYAPSPSHFAGTCRHEQTQCSLMHITSSRGLEEFYCRNELLASNNTATGSAPHQRCQHLFRVLYYSPTAQRTCDSSGDSSCCHL